MTSAEYYKKIHDETAELKKILPEMTEDSISQLKKLMGVNPYITSYTNTGNKWDNNAYAILNKTPSNLKKFKFTKKIPKEVLENNQTIVALSPGASELATLAHEFGHAKWNDAGFNKKPSLTLNEKLGTASGILGILAALGIGAYGVSKKDWKHILGGILLGAQGGWIAYDNYSRSPNKRYDIASETYASKEGLKALKKILDNNQYKKAKQLAETCLGSYYAATGFGGYESGYGTL